jgi:ABC-type transport system substrate-binding protein
MTTRVRRILALLLILAMALSLAACGSGLGDLENEIPESSGGKDVERAPALDNVFSVNSNSKYSKNPFVATNHANQLICSLVYENMIELDNNFEVIRGSGIISDWKCDDTGKNWELTIEPGHYFSDGTEVMPRDVSYSMGWAINSDRYWGRFASYQGASPGEGVVYVTLGIGDRQFIKLLNLPVIKHGTYGDLGPAGNTPIGSGPYCYNEEGDALIRNEYYPGYEDLPVDTIYLKEYNSADTIISAFEDGYIDVVINDPSSYTNLGYASSNEFHTFATTNMHFVAFNEESMLGKYSYFRIAMQHAFDRAYLVELLHGNAVAAALPMYPTCSAYPHALEDRLNYDLDTCKNILLAAGIQDYDEDGQLEFMSGSPQKIELHFVVCADSSAKCGIARRFQEDMASIGLRVTVHELTWAEYCDALEEGQFKAGKQTVPVDMYYGEVRLRNNFDLTELLQPRDESNEATNQNFTRSKDNTIVARIERYLAAPDATRADEFYQLCDYIMNTNGSFVVIGFEKQQIITRRGVCKGINPNYGNPLFGFPSWEITFDDADQPAATPRPSPAASPEPTTTDKGEKNDD